MSLLRQSLSRSPFQWGMLVFVGLLGLLITGWVSARLFTLEQERLEQRFQQAAHHHAEALIRTLHQPQTHLGTLQRFVGSVDHIDRHAFNRFAQPMLDQTGVHGYFWMPRIDAARRAAFEQEGQAVWGEEFAIVEPDAQGVLVRASHRERYFPRLYGVSEEPAQMGSGYDLSALAFGAQVINRAIESNALSSGEKISSTKGGMWLVLPVFPGGVIPATPAERQIQVSGVVVTELNVAELFAAATAHFSDSGLNARLIGNGWTADTLRIGASVTTASSKLMHVTNFDLAGSPLSIEVGATPAWHKLNRERNAYAAGLIGALLTLLVLWCLDYLFRRAISTATLTVEHENSLVEKKKAEAWASKIFMAVEQNPATIYITDMDGRIEYVNNTFVETSGYSRAEIIGQNARMLRPEQRDEAVYVELWSTLKAGQIWKGDLQTRRRDGTLIWERMLLSPIRDGEGTITHFIMIKENISELREVMSRLQESEGRFLAAMSVVVEGFAIFSPEGTYLFTNQTFNNFMECPEGAAVGLTPNDFKIERLREDGTICPPDDYPANTTLRTGQVVRDFVMGFRYADGNVRWVQINTSPLQIGEETRPGVVLTFSEITERRATEVQLKLAFEAIRHSGEGVFITDAENRVLSVNPAFEAMTGFSSQDVVGQEPAIFVAGRHDNQFFSEMNEVLKKSGHWQGEVCHKRKGGEFFPAWLGVSAVDDLKGRTQTFIYIFSDMTERKQAQECIEFMAHHDVLTGLPNRLLLRDRMEHAMAKANRMKSRVAMLFLDLDRFKTINDSLGHPVGDALLKEVVERLKGCVRESDTISRQGGDEFIVLLDDVKDSDSVARVADKIHMRMADPVILDGHTLMTSFSMGIALYPDDGDGFDALMQKADTAMYHAKAAGRNAHRFFTEEMNLQVVEHLTLENQLRQALANKEFVLHYQPQLCLREGRIIGVEALIRWNSPEGGLMSPARFIPVAEDSGLIVPIGAWVLGEACRQARAWQNAGLDPFVVAVNLSAVQFRRQDLVNNVINALVLSDLDSEWLELELTESILIQDAETTLDLVRRLKSLGVKLSVDDFGTGYSSLTYLKRFAVDKLKIDQTFVRDLLTDPDDAAIVRAIIEMAHSLKLKTIAEGVETEELANLLRIFNCDEIQGYWYARPMPADELEAFVREHQAKRD